MKKKYVASGERTRTKVNPTSAETEAALADIQHRYRLYTDGGCDDNGAGGVDGAAGWGVHVREATTVASLFAGETAMTTTAVADLWGRVELDEGSEFYHGCPRRTNNTAELSGVIQALLWLRWCATDEAGAAIILCDSCYAMDAVEDRIETTANVKLIELAKELLSAVQAVRTVTFVHVLGHSDDPGNEQADELVQWGKQEGPYAQLRTDGGREGRG